MNCDGLVSGVTPRATAEQAAVSLRAERAVARGARRWRRRRRCCLAAYWATASPGVTFWDSGEFIAALASWGIPHPPATPLYVTIGRAWVLLLGMLPVARAAHAALRIRRRRSPRGALALLVCARHEERGDGVRRRRSARAG